MSRPAVVGFDRAGSSALSLRGGRLGSAHATPGEAFERTRRRSPSPARAFLDPSPATPLALVARQISPGRSPRCAPTADSSNLPRRAARTCRPAPHGACFAPARPRHGRLPDDVDEAVGIVAARLRDRDTVRRVRALLARAHRARFREIAAARWCVAPRSASAPSASRSGAGRTSSFVPDPESARPVSPGRPRRLAEVVAWQLARPRGRPSREVSARYRVPWRDVIRRPAPVRGVSRRSAAGSWPGVGRAVTRRQQAPLMLAEVRRDPTKGAEVTVAEPPAEPGPADWSVARFGDPPARSLRRASKRRRTAPPVFRGRPHEEESWRRRVAGDLLGDVAGEVSNRSIGLRPPRRVGSPKRTSRLAPPGDDPPDVLGRVRVKRTCRCTYSEGRRESCCSRSSWRQNASNADSIWRTDGTQIAPCSITPICRSEALEHPVEDERGEGLGRRVRDPHVVDRPEVLVAAVEVGRHRSRSRSRSDQVPGSRRGRRPGPASSACAQTGRSVWL